MTLARPRIIDDPNGLVKARHSFITWNLMIGKNPLWVAKQHGHSAHLMLDGYASWIEGTDAVEIAAIEQAMQRAPAIWHQRRAGEASDSKNRNRLAEREADPSSSTEFQ